MIVEVVVVSAVLLDVEDVRVSQDSRMLESLRAVPAPVAA
jgi:hypothetical protein